MDAVLRHISYFEDLRLIAASAGVEAGRFQPISPDPQNTEDLNAIPDAAVVARVFDGEGGYLDVTAAALRAHIIATVPSHAQDLARWLALSHLRALANPDYPL
jgi:hypothetical protein